MAESKAELKALCRGNRTDRGWTQDEAGNWVASVFDRRRLGVAHAVAAAERAGAPAIPMGEVAGVLVAHHSTGDEDAKALLENFARWAQSAS